MYLNPEITKLPRPEALVKVFIEEVVVKSAWIEVEVTGMGIWGYDSEKGWHINAKDEVIEKQVAFDAYCYKSMALGAGRYKEEARYMRKALRDEFEVLFKKKKNGEYVIKTISDSDKQQIKELLNINNC